MPVNKNNLHVEVIDITSGKPINDCALIVEARGKNKVAALTESLGNVLFPVDGWNFPVTIKATKVGYETAYADVENNGNHDVRLFLYALKKENISRGQLAIYKIKVIADDLIELTPLNTTSDWKSRYRKAGPNLKDDKSF